MVREGEINTRPAQMKPAYGVDTRTVAIQSISIR